MTNIEEFRQIDLFEDTVAQQALAEAAIKKVKRGPKKVKEMTTLQTLASKKISEKEKIAKIEQEVNLILGQYKSNTTCIRDLMTLHNYIDAAIANSVIAIDTETNNSLEPITCKLMGACIYTNGQKNAYIPVNHIDIDTGELLPNQLTESQIKCEFQRLLDSNTKIIMHNAVFDIKVIECTCGIRLPCYWDTLIGAQILDENELKSLKAQYNLHVDSSQSKYDIEHLFKGLPYAIFDPDLFALYAATDAWMTMKLWEYQAAQFNIPDNAEIFNLFMTIEMPMVDVIVDMELYGIGIDKEYAKKMEIEYGRLSAELQGKIDDIMATFADRIKAWRQTKEALQPKITYLKEDDAAYEKYINGTAAEKEKVLKKYNKVDEYGNRYCTGKSKNELLKDPVELTSTQQLSILLYDVLKVPVVDTKEPTGTGKEILEELSEYVNLDAAPLCKLILEKRGVDKLLDTFIAKLPTLVLEKTGRLHYRLNSTGTKTGRLSSSDPNLQNIPSHDKAVRLLFQAKVDDHEVEEENNVFTVSRLDEVQLANNVWKRVQDVKVGDLLQTDDDSCYPITNIVVTANGDYNLYI